MNAWHPTAKLMSLDKRDISSYDLHKFSVDISQYISKNMFIITQKFLDTA